MRVKVAWSGAEVRGRARKVDWEGSLEVKGNSIRSVQPVNFWNADNPLRQVQSNRVEWESITTGGQSGCILELEAPAAGELIIKTKQGNVTHSLEAITQRPVATSLGGLAKKLEVSRLADAPNGKEMTVELPLDSLSRGDNPLYIRVLQEDGHMAWSSPVYAVG